KRRRNHRVIELVGLALTPGEDCVEPAAELRRAAGLAIVEAGLNGHGLTGGDGERVTRARFRASFGRIHRRLLAGDDETMERVFDVWRRIAGAVQALGIRVVPGEQPDGIYR